jgi:hypothetical protein
MRGLRSCLEKLHAFDKALADKFTSTSCALEGLALSSELHGIVANQGLLDARFNTQRRLQREWEELLGQIEGIAGFEGFLKAVPFGALWTTAAEEPVIIVNHDKHHSDALVLLDAGPPLLVPLGDAYGEICRVSSQFSTT